MNNSVCGVMVGGGGWREYDLTPCPPLLDERGNAEFENLLVGE